MQIYTTLFNILDTHEVHIAIMMSRHEEEENAPIYLNAIPSKKQKAARSK